MSTTYGATASGQTAVSIRRVCGFFRIYWGPFQERRKRRRLRATLCRLSDRELMDIGLTSSEIDHLDAGRALERLRDGTTYP